jgi:hypothetical protein
LGVTHGFGAADMGASFPVKGERRTDAFIILQGLPPGSSPLPRPAADAAQVSGSGAPGI